MIQIFKARISKTLSSAIGLLTIAAAAALTPSPARAAVPDPACKPGLDAMIKQMTTPHHAYMTEVAQLSGGKPVNNESISTGSAIYIQIKGQWRRSPMTPQDMKKQEEENARNAKSRTCHYLRDEPVQGEAAAVYRVQEDTEDQKTDSTVWVSKRTGLPLRIENDLDVGDKMGKRHLSIRYDYANVKAPAGVK
jgi:hypothetical protein